MSLNLKRFLLTTAVVSLVAVPAFAQVNQTRPEKIEKQFEKPVAPRSTLNQEGLPQLAPQRAPDGSDKVKLTLKNVNIEGLSVYQQSEIEPLYAAMIGKEISLTDVFAIADRVNTKYWQDGYILTKVIVPPQEINSGTVKLKVIEGYIEDVTVEGELEDGDKDLIDGYVSVLKSSKPATAADIERLVLLINELPGVTAKSVLKAGTAPGASDLAVIVEHEKFKGSATIDNRGTRFVGPTQTSVAGEANSVLGLYDQFTLRYITSDDPDELSIADFRYVQPVGAYGTKVNFGATRSSVEPGFTLSDDLVESDSIKYAAGFEHPVIRSRAENWYVTGNFVYRNSKTNTNDVQLSRDRIRTIDLGTNYDWVDSLLGVNLASVTATQGLNVLDATEAGTANLSRSKGHSDFTKLNFEASRLQQIDGPWSALLRMTGQYSFSQLLSAEEFAFGGEQYGRAYEPSEITGDHGAAGLLELRYSVFNEDEYYSDAQFYASYDIGATWTRDNNAADSRDSGASVAGGVRFTVAEGLNGDLQLAVPLTNPVSSYGEDGDGVRGFFSLVSRF